MSVETVMGTSITYMSEGDVDSPYSKAMAFQAGLDEAKYIDSQNAIQNYTGPSKPCAASTSECPKNIPGGIQQWME